MMKYVILALALAAAVKADDWNALDLDSESEARLLFSTNSSNSIIPDGRAIIGFFLVGVLLFALLGGTSLLPAERQYDDYYYNNQDYAQYGHDSFNARYGISNLATKMSQLEQAFKKFEVKTEECKMFVACEAAQFRKLEENVLIVKIANNILKNVDANEQDKIRPSIMNAYTEGRINHEKYVPNACGALRERCYVAHNA